MKRLIFILALALAAAMPVALRAETWGMDYNNSSKGLNVNNESTNNITIWSIADDGSVLEFIPARQLTVTVANPAKGSVSTSGGFYADGSEPSITATPELYNRLKSWTVNGELSDETGNVLALKLDKDISVTAEFIGIDTRLKTLEVDVVDVSGVAGVSQLTPAFNPEILSYTFRTSSQVQKIAIAATAYSSESEVTEGDTGEKSLTGDNTTFYITVTGEDGTTQETYTINVLRADETASKDVSLALSLNGENNVSVTGDTITFKVPGDATTATIAATAADGATILNYSEPITVTLTEENTAREITVVAENCDANKTYTVIVHRLNGDATLSSLTVMASGSEENLLNDFSSEKTLYAIDVHDNVTGVAVAYEATSIYADVTGDVEGKEQLAIPTDTLRITVTSEDKEKTITYKVAIHTLSSDATLESLSVTTGSEKDGDLLKEIFEADEDFYTVSVHSRVKVVTIAASANHPEAKVVTILGTKNLTGITDTFRIEVQAEDTKISPRTYTVVVNTLSNDTTLQSLTVDTSGVNLLTNFDPEETFYEYKVPSRIKKVTVAAQAKSDVADVKISGVSENRTLTTPTDTICITVTPEDDEIDPLVYKVVIYTLSNDTTLQSLSVKAGDGKETELLSGFVPDKDFYEVNVFEGVTEVTIATVTTHENATVEGKGLHSSLKIPTDTIRVKVQAEDKEIPQRTYTVVVHTLSNDVALNGITVTAGDGDGPNLLENFTSEINFYTVNVKKEVINVTIAAEKNNNDAEISEGNLGFKDPLTTPTDTFRIKVTSQDRQHSLTYTVVVRTLSDVATLSGLTVDTSSNGTGNLLEGFDPGKTFYEVDVPSRVKTVKVAAEPTNEFATVSGKGLQYLTPPLDTLRIEVTSEDGSSTKTYEVAIRILSGDATLSELTVAATGGNGDNLLKEFDPGITFYEFSVPSSVTNVTITPAKANEFATLSGDTDSKTLLVPMDTLRIKVKSEDASDSIIYTVAIRILSDVATLSGLTVDTSSNGNGTGNLLTGFATGTTFYELSVPSRVASVTVAAEPTNEFATVSGKGLQYLTPPLDTLRIKVKSEDASDSIIYTVAIRILSGDATLSELTVAATGGGSNLLTNFAPGVTSYAVSVPSSVTSVTVAAAATNDFANVSGDTGSKGLTAPTDTLRITVTSEDESRTITYTVAVRTLSNDATLQSLTVAATGGGSNLLTNFAPGVTSYAVSVPSSVTSVTVAAAATNEFANVSGDTGSKGLTAPTDTLRITVTSEDASNTITYTVAVRTLDDEVTLSNDATLQSLTVAATGGGSNLLTNFAPGVTSYAVSVPSSVTSVTVAAVAANANATLSGDTGSKTLSAPTDTLRITVTSEDASRTITYTVAVRTLDDEVTLSNDATLKSLTVAGQNGAAITLSPAFSASVEEYTASTSSATVTVTAAANHSAATVAYAPANRTLTLAAGATDSISITVTAENGSTKTYQIRVTRVDDTPSAVGAATLGSLTVYPNPVANGEVKIVNGTLQAGERIEIYSISGTLVAIRKVAAGPETAINVSQLPSGVYIVKAGAYAARLSVQQ
jgi:hypothetical protein